MRRALLVVLVRIFTPSFVFRRVAAIPRAFARAQGLIYRPENYIISRGWRWGPKRGRRVSFATGLLRSRPPFTASFFCLHIIGAAADAAENFPSAKHFRPTRQQTISAPTDDGQRTLEELSPKRVSE